MTKKVRIENADTSPYKVTVQQWNKGADGAPDVMESEKALTNPADMGEFWIHSTKYIVVKEATT